jgi:hypothetical protein
MDTMVLVAVAPKTSWSQDSDPAPTATIWLGTGVYFWQDAPNHALHWAQQNHPTEPAVIKSRLRIDNTCLDLLGQASNSKFKKIRPIFPGSAVYELEFKSIR